MDSMILKQNLKERQLQKLRDSREAVQWEDVVRLIRRTNDIPVNGQQA
jgi:hypothetical protein